MSDKNELKLDIELPFPTDRLAEIVYHVLRVDTEPKRSGVTKEITRNNNILQVHFTAPLARQLRVAVNGFFENINLITETIEFAGEPVSDSYSHFH